MKSRQASGIQPGTDQGPRRDSHHFTSTYVISNPYDKQVGLLIPILELIHGGLEKLDPLSKRTQLESAKVAI